MGEVFARRYELVQPIAEGGMGSVWKVLDHVDGQMKVAKLLRQRDAGAMLRFMREQATRIHHPHVVTPLSWVGEDDTILFTMPLVRGGSVSALVRQYGALPEQWVATIVHQTLDALSVVHDAGVVHRDVKPANLLLEPTGDQRPFVRLTDFGIAGLHGEPRLTAPSLSIGTPGYMAPEQSYGADPHPTQDVHGVAASALEMLTGRRPPFDEVEFPDTPLGALLERAMDPDPRERPASAREMRAELAPLVDSAWNPGHVRVVDQFAGPSHAHPHSGQGPRRSRPGTGPHPSGPRPSQSGPRSSAPSGPQPVGTGGRPVTGGTGPFPHQSGQRPVGAPVAAFAGAPSYADAGASSIPAWMPMTLVGGGFALLLLGLWLFLG